MTVQLWIEEATLRLRHARVDSARLDAQLLAAHHLGWTRSQILAHPEAKVDCDALEPLLARRCRREPLPYILGRREFFGREFVVSPAVLIPRPETEVLVEEALKVPFRSALDIGTGSGCLAITLKRERPEAEVWATDISREALAVARQNADRLGAEVKLSRADLWPEADRRFDLIVSNPPYVSLDDSLPDEVRLYEPKIALYAEEHGLAIYRRIAAESQARLRPEGTVLLEIGAGQDGVVADLFENQGYNVRGFAQDLSGIRRVLRVRLG